MEKTHRLFLRNLPANVTQNDIEEKFKHYGDIANIDIKEKSNAPDKENKFAFVSINTTDRMLNTCFQELKDLVINGCKVHMDVAKESFLARLQREREENKAAIAAAPKPAEPKTTIEPLKIAHPEIVRRPTKRKFDIDYETVPRPEPKVESKTAVKESERVVQLSTPEQKKKNESDEKRLKSLMEKKMTFKIKGGLIREALSSVDQKPLGKKTIFSDNMDCMENDSASNQKPKRLFDNDDNDEGDTEFKIRGNVYNKLQTLQSNFGNDRRFTLDDRFIEDEDEVVGNDIEPSPGLHEERDWQLDILQNVLGKPMAISRSVNAVEKRRTGMIRYDPTNIDHHESKIAVKTHNPKTNNNKKQKLVQNDADGNQPPELSKDTFYKVSDGLADAMKQDEQFSLLKTFGTAVSSSDNRAYEEPREKPEHLFNFGANDPFKYDSSGNETQDEEEILHVEKNQSRNDWNDSLFFNINDIQFEDARKFFNKRSTESNEFSTLRRELKQIVRSKIQNNLRKKMTWKKKKQHKS